MRCTRVRNIKLDLKFHSECLIFQVLSWSESSFIWPYNINNAHDIFLCVDDLKATRVIAVTTYKWILFVSSHKHLFTFVVTDEYIHWCTWSFCCTIHHMLLWQVVILKWCLPYLYFAFICYFRLINPVVVSPTVAAVRLSFFSYIWFC